MAGRGDRRARWGWSVVVVAVMVALVTTRATTPRAVPDSSSSEAELFADLNALRSSKAVAPLVRVSGLDAAARAWSVHQAQGSCPGGVTLCHRGNLAGVASEVFTFGWTSVGENVGYTAPQNSLADLNAAFIASPGHYANMVNAAFDAVGVGVGFAANGDLFVTYEFVATVGPPDNSYPDHGLPTPPAGLSGAGQFLWLLDQARSAAGAAPLGVNATMAAQAQAWSGQQAGGVCGGANCQDPGVGAKVAAALGPGQYSWWGEAVGSHPNAASAFVAMMHSAEAPVLLHAGADVVGVGVANRSAQDVVVTVELAEATGASGSTDPAPSTTPPGAGPSGPPGSSGHTGVEGAASSVGLDSVRTGGRAIGGRRALVE
jgi:uncharacterized protein YkwD